MDRNTLENKLKDIKSKQEKLEIAWKKTGNRELLQFFIDILPRVLDVARCSIFILDPEDEQVWLQTERGVVVPPQGSIVGMVISSGKPIVNMDMQSSVGEHDVVSMKTGFIPHNTLCVPVFGSKSGNRVIGVIQVLNKRGKQDYTVDDKEVLERLAKLISMNLEHIYLHQEIVKLSGEMQKKIRQLENKRIRSNICRFREFILITTQTFGEVTGLVRGIHQPGYREGLLFQAQG